MSDPMTPATAVLLLLLAGLTIASLAISAELPARAGRHAAPRRASAPRAGVVGEARLRVAPALAPAVVAARAAGRHRLPVARPAAAAGWSDWSGPAAVTMPMRAGSRRAHA